MMPNAGGDCVFMREAYGRRSAFLCGRTCLVVSRGGSIAAQAVSTAIFFNVLTRRVALASIMPNAGGDYVFMREAYGRRSAFLCGWACLMVSRDGSIAA